RRRRARVADAEHRQRRVAVTVRMIETQTTAHAEYCIVREPPLPLRHERKLHVAAIVEVTVREVGAAYQFVAGDRSGPMPVQRPRRNGSAGRDAVAARFMLERARNPGFARGAVEVV